MAEYIILSVLLFSTGLIRIQESFRQGRWEGSGRQGGAFHGEVSGKTLGLIGFGHIGRAVALRAKAFDMRVIAVGGTPGADVDLDWWGRREDLPRLLAEADFVAIVCPLTEQTRGLLGPAELRQLKATAYLINPARAEIIDEAALYRALSEKWFAGAALDVWYQYPSRPDEVLHGSRLPFYELDNTIITPHFSAWTGSLVERRTRSIARNLDHLAKGKPLEHIVYEAPPS